MNKISIEELVSKGEQEYIDLFAKENKTERDNKRLSLLKEQLNYAKEIWGL